MIWIREVQKPATLYNHWVISETRWRRSIHNVTSSYENAMRVFPSFTDYESVSMSILLGDWKADIWSCWALEFISVPLMAPYRRVASKNIIKSVYPFRLQPFHRLVGGLSSTLFREPALMLPSMSLSTLELQPQSFNARVSLPLMRPVWLLRVTSFNFKY